MDRMKRPARRAALVLVLLALALATTCSNPIDIVSEVQREVMLANDRFLEVTGVYPARDAASVNPSESIRVTFDRLVDAATIEGNVAVRYSDTDNLIDEDWGVEFSEATRTLTITPYPFLQNGKTVVVELLGGLRALDGTELADPVSFMFTTNNEVSFSFAFWDGGQRLAYANAALAAARGDEVVPAQITCTSSGNHLYYYISSAAPNSSDVPWGSFAAWPQLTDPTTLVETLSIPADGAITYYLWVYDANAGEPLITTAKPATILVDRTLPAFELGATINANAARTLAPAVTESGSGIASYAWSGTDLSFSAPAAASSVVSSTVQGEHLVTFEVTDRAGNVGSDTVSFVWDTIAPDPPTAPDLDAADDSGWFQDDDLTNASDTLTLSGSAEAGAAIDIILNGATIASAIADGAGAWSVDLPEMDDGAASLGATATDAAGNASAASGALTLVVDTYCPAPRDLELADDFDTRYSTDNITNLSTGLSIIGSVDEPGSRITLSTSTETLGTADSDGAGAWSVTGLDRSEGTHAIFATAEDPAGNASASSSVMTLIVDQTPPVVALGADFYARSGYQDSVTAGVTEANGYTLEWLRDSGVGVTFTQSTSATTGFSASSDGPAVLRCAVMDYAGNTGDDSVSMTWDATAPSAGAWRVDGAAAYALTAGVTLAPVVDPTDATSGVYQMQFSNNGTLWSAWEEYSSSKAWNLVTGEGGTTTEGARTVRFRVRDRALNVSATVDDSIIYDATAPNVGAWIIASGAAYTTSSSVTVGATTTATDGGSGVSSICLSNDGAIWSAWEAYSGSKAWDLASGAGGSSTQGDRTVYVKVRDAAGRESAVASDQIHYDYTAPVPPAWYIASGNPAYVNSTSQILYASGSATDNSSGPALVSFSNDGAAWSAWEAIVTSKSWSLPTGDGAKTVYVRYRDNAGNVSTSVSDSATLDTVAPVIGAWNLIGGSYVDSTGTVRTDLASASATITISATSAPSDNNGAVYRRFSSNNAAWSDWQLYSASTAAWDLTSTLVGGSTTQGSRSVYIQVKDQAGNQVATSDSIIYDTTPPLAPAVSSAALNTLDQTPTWNWTSGGGGGGTLYRYRLDTGSWSTDTSVTTYTPGTLLSNAVHTLYVTQKDATWNYYSPIDSYPVRVTPILPYDGQTNVSKTPTMQWRPLSIGYLGTYYIELYNAGTRVWDVMGSTTSTSFTVPTTLPGLTTFMWRIRTVDPKSGIVSYIPDSGGAQATTMK